MANTLPRDKMLHEFGSAFDSARAPYDEAFYLQCCGDSLRSARRVVPLLSDILRPSSVIDVGCGIGTWLSVFIEFGIRDVLGLDGAWVQEEWLRIPKDHFRTVDLGRPIPLQRTFDLAICLEVAEHVPGDHAALLVAAPTKPSPIVVFGAAVPRQGGRHHVNEQWPDYWAEHFAARGFKPLDCLRRLVWNDAAVEFWYSQNMILFAAENQWNSLRESCGCLEDPDGRILSLAHPRMYAKALASLDENRPENLTTAAGTAIAAKRVCAIGCGAPGDATSSFMSVRQVPVVPSDVTCSQMLGALPLCIGLH